MAYPLVFNKQDAERCIEAIESQAPLPLPKGGEWSIDVLLALAGVIHCRGMALGSRDHPLSPEQQPEISEKQLEATGKTLIDEIECVIGFNSYLAALIICGRFDEFFGPLVCCTRRRTSKGNRGRATAGGPSYRVFRREHCPSPACSARATDRPLLAPRAEYEERLYRPLARRPPGHPFLRDKARLFTTEGAPEPLQTGRSVRCPRNSRVEALARKWPETSNRC
jgi:hypothetical protein